MGIGHPLRLCDNNMYKSVFTVLTMGFLDGTDMAIEDMTTGIGKEFIADVFSLYGL